MKYNNNEIPKSWIKSNQTFRIYFNIISDSFYTPDNILPNGKLLVHLFYNTAGVVRRHAATPRRTADPAYGTAVLAYRADLLAHRFIDMLCQPTADQALWRARIRR